MVVGENLNVGGHLDIVLNRNSAETHHQHPVHDEDMIADLDFVGSDYGQRGHHVASFPYIAVKEFFYQGIVFVAERHYLFETETELAVTDSFVGMAYVCTQVYAVLSGRFHWIVPDWSKFTLCALG